MLVMQTSKSVGLHSTESLLHYRHHLDAKTLWRLTSGEKHNQTEVWQR
ncbi:hypothetical protein GQ600_4548 [Phytophthora cactorum]|nr:hypothetical protein GQ600_4548 [Phytophthora cactorum]